MVQAGRRRRAAAPVDSHVRLPLAHASSADAGGTPEPATPTDRSQLRAVRLGVAAALVVFLVLATFDAYIVPTFNPPDEASHVGYALEVSHGRLPTIDTPISTTGLPRLEPVLGERDAQRRTIWTANHPPLFYVLMAVPVRAGLVTAPSLAGIRAARLVNVALAALGILLLAMLAWQLVPGRPEITVAAAGLASVIPAFVYVSGILYNDVLAFVTTTATLLATVVFLRRGPSWPRLALVAATAAAAALTRASGLFVVAIAVLGVLAGMWLHDRRPARPRALAALGAASLVGLATVATSGWFYLRNLRLYGDLTGAGALFEKFDRVPRGSIPATLLAPGFWWYEIQRALDYSFDWRRTTGSNTLWMGVLLLVPLAGATVIVARRWRSGTWPRRPGPRLVSWGLCAVFLAMLQLSIAEFASRGGNAHGRYLFPGLAVLATAAALGLAALPGGRRSLPTVGTIALLAGLNFVILDQYLFRGVPTPPGHTSIEIALAAIGGPPQALVIVPMLVVITAALAVQARMLWRLSPPRPAGPAPVPALVPERERIPV